MLQKGKLWFLIADGRRARVLVEAKRGAVLEEPAEWVFVIGDEDRYTPQDRPARAFDSTGAGRHAMDGGRNLHEQEEVNFLTRVATRISDAEKQGAFEHLVIAAPPRALGLLRPLLSDLARARVRADLAKDVLSEEPPRLRERLRDALLNV